MELTYELVMARHAQLMNIGKEMKLPRKVSAVIARNILKLEDELKEINKQREEIAQQYAQKGEDGKFIVDGNQYTFEDDEKKLAFLRENNELNHVKVEVNITKINRTDLDKCEEDERYDILTPVQEAALDWMITDEE